MELQPLADLLHRRMVEEECSPADPITVSDLLQRLIPYRLCRSELRFATKAEYDILLLQLLGDSDFALVEDGRLRKAIHTELQSPEPGLGFLGGHEDAEIALVSAAACGLVLETGAEQNSGADADSDFGPESSAEPDPDDGSDPDDFLPALDDLLFSADTSPPAEEAKSAVGCRSCELGLPSIEDLRYCPSCGADQDVWKCESCAGEIRRPWRFCPRCGTEQAG